MTLAAFVAGQTIVSAANMNQLLSMHDVAIITDGTKFSGKEGAGIAEFDCAGLNRAVRFTATGVDEVTRLELELIKNGSGADLAVEIRTGFNPDGSTDGTLLKSMTIPKEFIPEAKSYWSIPLDLTGLTLDSQYWVVIPRSGDATNHFHVHGETSQDASYPCYYRAGATGGWTADNAIHFRVYAGVAGRIQHSILGGRGVSTLIRTNGLVATHYYYLPPADGVAGVGIRNIKHFTRTAEGRLRRSED